MDADPSAIEQFTQITGADDSTAKFFLSAANNDCDAAVSAFFESGGIIPPAGDNPSLRPARPTAIPVPLPSAPVPSAAAPPSTARRPGAVGGGRGGIAGLGRGGPSSSSNRRGGANSSNQRIATLGSLERERDDDEKGYYAGGEKSGQMIQDPRKHNGNGGNGRGRQLNEEADTGGEGGEDGEGGLAEAILERARERGPRTDEERAEFEGTQRFAGAGYRLGNTNAAPPARPTVIGRRNVTRVLTFYANGFRVDEGPLRPFDDPANEAFLADVNRGVVPKEMEEPGVGDVSITLVDKKTEESEKERASMVPFSGGGQRLSGSSSSAAAAAPTTNTSEGGEEAPKLPVVDDGRPVARVQIRLSDGTRLVARLTEEHTVGDIRQFVRASRPTATRDFVLATSFPRHVLEDESLTIKDANLNGAVIIQTLK